MQSFVRNNPSTGGEGVSLHEVKAWPLCRYTMLHTGRRSHDHHLGPGSLRSAGGAHAAPRKADERSVSELFGRTRVGPGEEEE